MNLIHQILIDVAFIEMSVNICTHAYQGCDGDVDGPKCLNIQKEISQILIEVRCKWLFRANRTLQQNY